ESSTGGLVAASLLAQPGASAYFLGGAVVYTRQARAAPPRITEEMMARLRPASRAHAPPPPPPLPPRLRAPSGLPPHRPPRPPRQPLGRSAGPCLHRRRRRDRARRDARHRARQPRAQHGGVRLRRACALVGSLGRDHDRLTGGRGSSGMLQD